MPLTPYIKINAPSTRYIAPPLPLDPTLIAWYPLSNSHQFDDISGHGMTSLGLNGSLTFTTIGGKDCSTGFSGSDSFQMSQELRDAMCACATGITIEFDVYLNSTGDYWIWAMDPQIGGPYGNEYAYSNFVSTNQSWFRLPRPTCFVIYSNTMTPGQWYTVSLTGTPTSAKIYWNGSLVASSGENGLPGALLTTVGRIGSFYAGQSPLNGYLANFKVWNVEKTTFPT